MENSGEPDVFAAWSTFCDQVKQIGQDMLGGHPHARPEEQAETIQFVSRVMRGALERSRRAMGERASCGERARPPNHGVSKRRALTLKLDPLSGAGQQSPPTFRNG